MEQMEWHQTHVFNVFGTIPPIPLQPLPRARPSQLRCNQLPVVLIEVTVRASGLVLLYWSFYPVSFPDYSSTIACHHGQNFDEDVAVCNQIAKFHEKASSNLVSTSFQSNTTLITQ